MCFQDILDILYHSGGPFRFLFALFRRKSGKNKAGVKASTLKKPAKSKSKGGETFEEPAMVWSVAGYISYTFLFVVNWIRELIYGPGPWRGKSVRPEKEVGGQTGYAPLYSSFEGFYIRSVYRRYNDISNQPVASVPGAKITLLGRESDDDFWSHRIVPTQKMECINLGSYNYLGFAENHGTCTDQAIEMVKHSGLTISSSRLEFGTLPVHKELEATVAKFLGVEDSITLGMGFATNTLNLPCLLQKGTLVISDKLNHASIILGLRLSEATVNVFEHNDMDDLERKLRNAIIRGHPRTGRPWNKIIIVVEGVYSMEGTIVNLPEVIALKKKYNAYLYLDEAHSVGAMGPRGRGVVDYYGLNPQDVDILMGTFSKSFGAAGGYIAGSRTLINYLRVNSQSFVYPTSMSPGVCQQVIAAMNSIMQPEGDGLKRVKRLARNSRYFRRKLQQMGFIVYGHDDSPVVPLMLLMPAKIKAFMIECHKYKLATIVVGFPAIPMTKERARFCMSAGHTKDMIDQALHGIDKVGDYINCKYALTKKFQGVDITY
jgi:serine palmitoyltransferase